MMDDGTDRMREERRMAGRGAWGMLALVMPLGLGGCVAGATTPAEEPAHVGAVAATTRAVVEQARAGRVEAREKVRAAAKAVYASMLARDPIVPLDVESVEAHYTWSCRWLAAELAVAKTAGEREEAVRAHGVRMINLHAIVKERQSIDSSKVALWQTECYVVAAEAAAGRERGQELVDTARRVLEGLEARDALVAMSPELAELKHSWSRRVGEAEVAAGKGAVEPKKSARGHADRMVLLRRTSDRERMSEVDYLVVSEADYFVAEAKAAEAGEKGVTLAAAAREAYEKLCGFDAKAPLTAESIELHFVWSRRVMEGGMAETGGPVERRKAVRGHLERMRELRAAVKKRQVICATRFDLLATEYFVAEAAAGDEE